MTELQREYGNACLQRVVTRASAPVLQRDPVTAEKPAPAASPFGVNYASAERRNRNYATRLGWASRLADVRPDWHALWTTGNVNGFADAVAGFQSAEKFKVVDGVLGPKTWNRVRPIGEVIAEQAVTWEDSKSVCFRAAEERLKKGYEKATGEKLVAKDDAKMFDWILKSRPDKMAEVPEEYRGTGAAGALVYLGKGAFVSEADIWDGRALRPGAAMQGWWDKSGYEDLKAAKATGGVGGTSFVFVEYVGDDKMRVLHFDQVEVWKRDYFEVWIGANLLGREDAEE